MASFSESASSVDSSKGNLLRNRLEAGLAAMQQGNYTEAISLLETYINDNSQSEQPDVWKAQMGLVRSYAQTQRMPEAVALCQSLRVSRSEKARSWADQMLKELSFNQTGFVPLDAEQSMQRTRRTIARRSNRLAASSQTAAVADAAIVDLQTREANHQTREANRQSRETNYSSATSATQSAATPFTWRNAARSQRWQPLKPLNPVRLQWAEMATVAALFATLYGLWSIVDGIPYLWFYFLTSVLRQSAVIPTSSVSIWGVGLGLVSAFIASPWLLDAILQRIYGMKSLSTVAIATHSPETHRLIQRFAQQQKIPIPKLGVLPTQTAIAFSYGCLPKFARIVVSEGLLDQLSDDEIAAIYATQLGQIQQWDIGWMSGVIVLLQLPYTLYRQSAIASDWLRSSFGVAQSANRGGIVKKESVVIAQLLLIGADLAAFLSAASYGLFWLLRWSGLWLSKARIASSDRIACNLTGNPNGLIRALLKCSMNTAQVIQQNQKTDYLLEGFELLMPVGYRHAITIGSLIDQKPLSALLLWEQVNTERHWLAINNSHPLWSDRITKLVNYAKHWNLEPELDLDFATPSTHSRIRQQGAPFWGCAIGFFLAQSLWCLAQIAHWLGSNSLNWLASDYKLFASFSLIGFGLGTIVRFNQFFPELRKLEPATSITDLVTKPDLIPLDSQAIRLEGTLLGRSGASNGLAQDLILQTETGLIKLHFLSQLGALGNLLPQALHPMHLIGQSVTVTGWFRRGATPWIDVDTLKVAQRSAIRGGHQIWSTIVAIASVLFGLILIL